MLNQPAHRRPPPMGIFHLLTLTAGVAIAFAIQNRADAWMNASDAAPNFNQDAVLQVLEFVSLTNLGGGLAGIVWLLDWKRRVGSIWLQPGHWLIMAWGISLLIIIPLILLIFNFVDFETVAFGEFGIWWIATSCLPRIIMSGVLFLGAFYTVGAWKWLLVGFGVQELLVPFWESWMPAQLGMQVVTMVWILSLVIVDLSRKTIRDWLHYFSVVLFLLGASTQLAMMVYIQYFWIAN